VEEIKESTGISDTVDLRRQRNCATGIVEFLKPKRGSEASRERTCGSRRLLRYFGYRAYQRLAENFCALGFMKFRKAKLRNVQKSIVGSQGRRSRFWHTEYREIGSPKDERYGLLGRKL
jgi:hypothetical protein